MDFTSINSLLLLTRKVSDETDKCHSLLIPDLLMEKSEGKVWVILIDRNLSKHLFAQIIQKMEITH